MGKHSAVKTNRRATPSRTFGRAEKTPVAAADAPGPPRRHAAKPDTSENVRRMAKGGSLNLVGAIIQQGSLLVVMALLARQLGTADVGRYAECWSLLSLLGLLSLAGFRAGLTRFVAVFLAEDDASRVRGTIRLGIGVTIVSSTIIATLLALFADQVAAYFRDPSLVLGVRLTALALPAVSFSDAALSATQGWRTQRAFAYIGRIFDPLTLLGLTGLAILFGFGLKGAFISIAVGAWSTATLAAVALIRQLRTVPKAKPVMEPRRIFGFSIVSWFSSLAATGLIWTGTLILGNLTDAASVGVFNVATRLVSLAVFVMAPITTSFSPHMAHLHHVGDHAEGARAYGNATRWILFISTPAFIMLIVLPEQMLALFGHDFRVGASVTMILAVGQFVAAAAGPCGVVLNMSGRVGLSLVDNVGVLVLNIVLSLVLVPRWGIVGAAVAWSVSLIAVNLTKLAQARHIVGVRPVGANTTAIIAAGLPAAAVGWVVRETVENALVAVALGGLLVCAVYLVVGVRLGLHPDDQALVRRVQRQVLGRFRPRRNRVSSQA